MGLDDALGQALFHNRNKLGIRPSERNQLVTIRSLVLLGPVRRYTQCFRQPCVPLRDRALIGTRKGLSAFAASRVREFATALNGLADSPARTGNDHRCSTGFGLLAGAWGMAQIRTRVNSGVAGVIE